MSTQGNAADVEANLSETYRLFSRIWQDEFFIFLWPIKQETESRRVGLVGDVIRPAQCQ